MPPTNPPELPHTIQKHPITRAETVHFHCPACRDILHAPLGDAGTTDACPSCGGAFRVPGVEARRAADQRRAREESQRAEAEARKAGEAAKHRESLERAQSHAKAVAEAKARKVPKHAYTQWCHRAGAWFLVFGVFFLVIAIVMPTYVEVDRAGGLFSDRVQNIGLLNTRLCVLVFACFATVGGVLLRALASIGDEIHRSGRRARRRR